MLEIFGMSTLFGTLQLARQALVAQQVGIDVTQNNIANVNTPGYARQRADFVPGDTKLQYSYQLGCGVQLASITSYRSRLMDIRVNDELQRQGEYDASSQVLQQVEALFNENTGSGLQSSISAFFNSFGSLANMPEDASLRQQVLASAADLGSRFQSIYEQVQSLQTQQNLAISETVSDINSTVSAIARLNKEIEAAKGAMSNENNLVDQRQELIDKLAGLIDISYYESDSGSITITTRQGALMATGYQASSWQTASGPNNEMKVLVNGKDITDNIQSGKLGGILKVRDTKVASYLTQLDDLAAAIISRVNTQHAAGVDINGDAGGNFFVPFVPTVPGSNQGAARHMDVAIADTDKIAAGIPGEGSGSNGNAKLLAEVQNEKLLSGGTATVSDSYANLVFSIGLDTRASVDGNETQGHLLAQLQNQRDSTSGVSLDEEAVNLMRYQKAYQASARFISIVDALTDDVLRILGG
jgi:flagellar hook-associated protein 1